MSVRILVGDARDVLTTLPDASIDLTVTSPPYDNLRTYGGFPFDFEGVARQLFRDTKPGGVVVWVVGDATVKGSETGTSFRHALFFKDVCGFNIHDTMIYQKAGTGACGSHYAYWQAFEYMFVLSKGKPKAINRLSDKVNVWGGTKTSARDRVAKDGSLRSMVSRTIPSTSVRDNVWRYAVGNNNGDDKVIHPAKFPEALARDHIASWSHPGDMVLDPFIGSGTTAKMAGLSNRDCIGIDINATYADLASARLTAAGLSVTIEHPHQPAAQLEAAE